MTKHVLDQSKTHKGSRMSREFARIDGEAGPSPQTKALQKRGRAVVESRRLKAYADIERRNDS